MKHVISTKKGKERASSIFQLEDIHALNEVELRRGYLLPPVAAW
jgi:hypothetical protein